MKTLSFRQVLRGKGTLMLRLPAEPVRRSKVARSSRPGADRAPALPLDDVGLARSAGLKAWRAEVARGHGLPACGIFHDAMLAEVARERPATLDDLAGISGVGAKKLQAHGQEILRLKGAP